MRNYCCQGCVDGFGCSCKLDKALDALAHHYGGSMENQVIYKPDKEGELPKPPISWQYQTWTSLSVLEHYNQEESLEAIRQERRAQDEKWGINWSLSDHAFLAILTEEVGEIAKAINERDFVGLRKEIVQVAAVCVRWLVAISIKTKPSTRKRVL